MRPRFQPSLLFLLCSSLLVVILVFMGGCNSEAKAPKRLLTTQEQHGQEVFQANCAICHNVSKDEPLQGPALRGLYKKDLPSGMPPTDEHVRDAILFGRKMMPAFNLLLSDQQVADLIAYLHTL